MQPEEFYIIIVLYTGTSIYLKLIGLSKLLSQNSGNARQLKEYQLSLELNNNMIFLLYLN